MLQENWYNSIKHIKEFFQLDYSLYYMVIFLLFPVYLNNWIADARWVKCIIFLLAVIWLLIRSLSKGKLKGKRIHYWILTSAGLFILFLASTIGGKEESMQTDWVNIICIISALLLFFVESMEDVFFHRPLELLMYSGIVICGLWILEYFFQENLITGVDILINFPEATVSYVTLILTIAITGVFDKNLRHKRIYYINMILGLFILILQNNVIGYVVLAAIVLGCLFIMPVEIYSLKRYLLVLLGFGSMVKIVSFVEAEVMFVNTDNMGTSWIFSNLPLFLMIGIGIIFCILLEISDNIGEVRAAAIINKLLKFCSIVIIYMLGLGSILQSNWQSDEQTVLNALGRMGESIASNVKESSGLLTGNKDNGGALYIISIIVLLIFLLKIAYKKVKTDNCQGVEFLLAIVFVVQSFFIGIQIATFPIYISIFSIYATGKLSRRDIQGGIKWEAD